MSETPFIDSVLHYTAPNATRKWTSRTNLTISTSVPGWGGLPVITDPSELSRTFADEYSSFTLGAPFVFTGFFGFLFQATNARFGNSGSSPNLLAQLAHVGDGRLQIVFAFGGVAIIPGFVGIIGVRYFIEVNFALNVVGSNTVLSWEVHINNNVVGSGTLTLTGSQYASFASIGWNVQQASSRDFYCTTTGEFFGDSVCRAFFARVDGTYAAGVPSTAGAHNLMVKEHDPDDAATTIELAATSDRDSYLMDTIAGFTTVKCAQFLWCASKSSAGPASFKGTLTNSGTDALSPEYFPGAGDYGYFIDGHRLSPFTGSDWTTSELNATEVGTERIT